MAVAIGVQALLRWPPAAGMSRSGRPTS